MNVTGKARLAGVMGWPVTHSRSPQLHNYWLDHHGIDGAYVPLSVRPEALSQALRALTAMGFVGVNLTVPHKESALAMVDVVDPVARRIGAVNTIVVDGERGLVGRNTDGFGFIENLRQGAPDWHGRGGVAVVVGAGGAARAICVALQDAGIGTLRIVNRTAARARMLADAIGAPAEVVDWAARNAALAGANLLVNTTTLGMHGQPSLELALDELSAGALVTDIVYAPLETPLLVAARARGNPVVDGLGMLLHQARPGFEAWFGVAPAVTPALRAAVLRDR